MAQSQEIRVTPEAVKNHMLSTIYGQCVGDALGLLTEFMIKKEAKDSYGKKPTDLTYEQKISDFHRNRWAVGDWTDDTDQMILILQSLLYKKGEVVAVDFAPRMRYWMFNGFTELGDRGGIGIGKTTSKVLGHKEFPHNPEKVAKEYWEKTGSNVASNGSVMRTSILGLHQWRDVEKVKENALTIGKATHYDPRCQASVVAVTTCIALMLQHTDQNIDNPKAKKLDVDHLIRQSYDLACHVLDTPEQKQELWKYMSCTKLKKLQLCEGEMIGYTYKCMGCGFWALKQDDFKKAMIKVVMEAGDADTNACVAGAMLGCKLGLAAIPSIWISGLKHKNVIDDLYQRFIKLESEMDIPLEDRSDGNEDLSIENIRQRGEQLLRSIEIKIDEDRKRRERELGVHNS